MAYIGNVVTSFNVATQNINNDAITTEKIADGAILNIDVNSAAAIAGTKINPDFGSQTIATTGVFSHALGAVGTPSITFTGDLNTGIWSPAADTIAFAEGGVETMRIDSSGRVGIGTSAPSGFIHIQGTSTGTETYGRFTTGSASGDQSLVIKSGSSRDHMAIQVSTNAGVADDLALQPDGGRVGIGTTSPSVLTHLSTSTDTQLRVESTSASGTNEAAVQLIRGSNQSAIKNKAGGLEFFVQGLTNEVARIDSSGRLLVGTSTANANGGVLQLSGGITFPGTAVAATDVNTLDDYEEGTWTPSVGGSATYQGATSGTYTKIGNTVYCSCRIHINVIGTGSVTTFTGLPFTPNQTGGINAGGGVSYYNSSATNVASIGMQVSTAANTVLIVGTSGAQASITNGVTFFQNGTDFIVSFFYKA